MPKAASSKSPSITAPNNSRPVKINGGLSLSQQHVLKRNQACHQCRRRKLVSDAKRPCSTCVRSHSHAAAHAPAGLELPPHPDCTYDEAPDTNASSTEIPKNKYEKLESRILELESLLKQKGGDIISREQSTSDSPSDSLQSHSTNDFGLLDPLTAFSSVQALTSPDDILDPSIFQSDSLMQDLALTIPPILPQQGTSDVYWPHWPPHLPRPDLLRHLVETFFACHPLASRLFHVPTFMTALSLPPDHPKFPISPVLHAICAVSGIYTAAVTSPQFTKSFHPDEIFLQNCFGDDDQHMSFTEQHARYAKRYADEYMVMGHNLMQCLQAYVILTWYYWCHSKWVELFTGSGHSMRTAVPLGLNVCPPFQSISKTLRSLSIVPPARDVVEDEMRRNTFWLAYAIDRQHGSGTGWALSLDDQDISQLLPVRGDNFETGALIAPEDRQWSHDKEMLILHPPDQTDSFVLYIKSTMLLSRVKNFNHRFRSRHHCGDIAATPTHGYSRDSMFNNLDARTAPGFMELDELIAVFKASIPSHLKDPFMNGGVDSLLYTTSLVPHVSMILLHDPHAEVEHAGCTSALKILIAARGILDLLYGAWSTNYDMGLLDYFCPFCWFLAGRVLARFYKAALDAKSAEQSGNLQTELEFVLIALNRMGERVPLAYRYFKMLSDLYCSTKL
ncbi:hypothetical protein SERLA73DRAFT_84116 [Serpula lacrymans var. lacrymans S7.3]|uniref:Xylanolytic transcriptional activator regulatory domain-containing protein n=1 Tax=Serpula lacrymans var. lacrymans (strain S7.3) TaxID=936435 RepID=F8PKV7_SERL3|nr:hypothetical protein SERLA73DRAFT_84116 [Serpula lacrymans var. lacrymans S7.3]